MEVNVKDDGEDKKKPAPKKEGGEKKGPPKKKSEGQEAQGPPPFAPQGQGMPKPGQGMDPMQAMMQGMGDLGAFGPPPAPEGPIGPGGLPIGGNLPSSDPMMDPSMDGSGLFQALNMQLDPYSAGPLGHPVLDDPNMNKLQGLLQLLALNQSGVAGLGMGAPSASGIVREPTHPGETIGLSLPNVIQ